MTEQQLQEEVNLMVVLQKYLRAATHDCINAHVEGDEVPIAPIMGAITWVLSEMMVDMDIEFNKDFLKSLKDTYDAVYIAKTAMPDDASVH